ncbi:MAG: succinylglutamate desuccinylase/aspartoacylase family protein [Halobacteriaceae archaeon]
MADGESAAFTYDGGRVDPGERQELRYSISESYLGDPIRIPVTIVNGDDPGPTAVLTAAAHGDELNGIEVVRTVATDWPHTNLQGTLICLPVLNVPGFLFQERYLPIYERDLNRAFPGSPESTSAKRMANEIFRNFIEPADIGLDFHTSTRGRNNMLHTRADMSDQTVDRLARAFGTNVIIDSLGPAGSLRREASEAGTPTVTVEMGEAHRFQRDLIDRALDGVASVFSEFGLYQTEAVNWPGWRTVITKGEKTWIRAEAGGIVEMHAERGDLVTEGEAICRISNPFGREENVVEAPFDGLLVGALENPVVYPGNPLCHLVELDERTQRAYVRAETGTMPTRPEA